MVMKNGEQPAFTVKPYPKLGNDVKDGFGAFGGYNPTGLTKREYFAAMAMQGLCASQGWAGIEGTVEQSIKYADELLKQLEQK